MYSIAQLEDFLKKVGTHVFFIYEAPWCIEQDIQKIGPKSGPDCKLCKKFIPVWDSIINQLEDTPDLYFYPKQRVTQEEYNVLQALDVKVIPIITIWKRYPSGKLYHVRIHIKQDGTFEFQNLWLVDEKIQSEIVPSSLLNRKELESPEVELVAHDCRSIFRSGLNPSGGGSQPKIDKDEVWDKEQVIEYILGAMNIPEFDDNWPLPPAPKTIEFVCNISNGGVRIKGKDLWNIMPCEIEVTSNKTYVFEFKDIVGYNTPSQMSIAIYQNQNYKFNVEYVIKKYNLTIDSGAPGAKYKLKGIDSTWQNVPDTRNLNYGNYIVEWIDIEGYETPSNDIISLDSNKEINKQYNLKTFTFKVSSNINEDFDYFKFEGNDEEHNLPYVSTISYFESKKLTFFSRNALYKAPDLIEIVMPRDKDIVGNIVVKYTIKKLKLRLYSYLYDKNGNVNPYPFLYQQWGWGGDQPIVKYKNKNSSEYSNIELPLNWGNNTNENAQFVEVEVDAGNIEIVSQDTNDLIAMNPNSSLFLDTNNIYFKVKFKPKATKHIFFRFTGIEEEDAQYVDKVLCPREYYIEYPSANCTNATLYQLTSTKTAPHPSYPSIKDDRIWYSENLNGQTNDKKNVPGWINVAFVNAGVYYKNDPSLIKQWVGAGLQFIDIQCTKNEVQQIILIEEKYFKDNNVNRVEVKRVNQDGSDIPGESWQKIVRFSALYPNSIDYVGAIFTGTFKDKFWIKWRNENGYVLPQEIYEFQYLNKSSYLTGWQRPSKKVKVKFYCALFNEYGTTLSDSFAQQEDGWNGSLPILKFKDSKSNTFETINLPINVASINEENVNFHEVEIWNGTLSIIPENTNNVEQFDNAQTIEIVDDCFVKINYKIIRNIHIYIKFNVEPTSTPKLCSWEHYETGQCASIGIHMPLTPTALNSNHPRPDIDDPKIFYCPALSWLPGWIKFGVIDNQYYQIANPDFVIKWLDNGLHFIDIMYTPKIVHQDIRLHPVQQNEFNVQNAEIIRVNQDGSVYQGETWKLVKDNVRYNGPYGTKFYIKWRNPSGLVLPQEIYEFEFQDNVTYLPKFEVKSRLLIIKGKKMQIDLTKHNYSPNNLNPNEIYVTSGLDVLNNHQNISSYAFKPNGIRISIQYYKKVNNLPGNLPFNIINLINPDTNTKYFYPDADGVFRCKITESIRGILKVCHEYSYESDIVPYASTIKGSSEASIYNNTGILLHVANDNNDYLMYGEDQNITRPNNIYKIALGSIYSIDENGIPLKYPNGSYQGVILQVTHSNDLYALVFCYNHELKIPFFFNKTIPNSVSGTINSPSYSPIHKARLQNKQIYDSFWIAPINPNSKDDIQDQWGNGGLYTTLDEHPKIEIKWHDDNGTLLYNSTVTGDNKLEVELNPSNDPYSVIHNSKITMKSLYFGRMWASIRETSNCLYEIDQLRYRIRNPRTTKFSVHFWRFPHLKFKLFPSFSGFYNNSNPVDRVQDVAYGAIPSISLNGVTTNRDAENNNITPNIEPWNKHLSKTKFRFSIYQGMKPYNVKIYAMPIENCLNGTFDNYQPQLIHEQIIDYQPQNSTQVYFEIKLHTLQSFNNVPGLSEPFLTCNFKWIIKFELNDHEVMSFNRTNKNKFNDTLTTLNKKYVYSYEESSIYPNNVWFKQEWKKETGTNNKARKSLYLTIFNGEIIGRNKENKNWMDYLIPDGLINFITGTNEQVEELYLPKSSIEKMLPSKLPNVEDKWQSAPGQPIIKETDYLSQKYNQYQTWALQQKLGNVVYLCPSFEEYNDFNS